MRGTLQYHTYSPRSNRITPAYAGNTLPPFSSILCSQDHPRLCGEHLKSYCNLITGIGSPPPMRGTLDLVALFRVFSGITPAYAGNTRLYVPRRCQPQDHPRLCGEHILTKQKQMIILGSPPPMRGTRKNLIENVLDLRITPAYAGNTWIFHRQMFSSQDHPRLCGEHYFSNLFRYSVKGSPPPMRGTLPAP